MTTLVTMSKTAVAALVLVGSGLTYASPAEASGKPPLPVVRVDKQCVSGHNPHCRSVWVSRLVGDVYRPVGVWIKFSKGRVN